MSRRRGLSAFGLFLLLPSVALAGGRGEEEYHEVTGTANWEHTIDVSELEPGRYNIVVRARDAAGNESIGGPYNVFVDPESGLPTVTILYPRPEQRAAREVFVVGTTQDNEGIARVEVRINDGAYQRAEGGEFWSARLSLANLADGPHTVTARATDTSGRTGPEQTVAFRLDTRAPELELASHDSGVFVSRRTTVAGTVADANGVASMRLIRDGTAEDLPLRSRRDTPSAFSFRIDPSNLDQGPHVWWLEATDRTGQIGTTPFLFYVDTEPPELEILYPGPEDRVDAQLRFVGRVDDAVGVDALAWEVRGGPSGTIPLVPGDEFWTLAVDLPPQTRGNATVTFTATDVAGNEVSERLRLAIDQAGDRPVVELLGPQDGTTVERAVLAGHVRDDDGVAEVIYTVNGGPQRRIPAHTGFLVPLDDLGPGRHDIRLRAVDRYGTLGDEVRTRFEVATPLPAISIERVIREEADEPYAPGFVVAPRERVSLAGQVTGPSPVGRVSYLVGSEAGRTAVSDDGSFTIGLPRLSEASVQDIRIWYENELERRVDVPGFYIQLSADEPGAETDRFGELPPGIYARAPESAAAHETESARSVIVLPPGGTLTFAASGGAVSDVRVIPDVDFLASRIEGELIVLEARTEGATPELVVEARVGGRTLRSAPLAVATTAATPQIAPPESTIGARLSAEADVSVEVAAQTGVRQVRMRTAAIPARVRAAQDETETGPVGPAWVTAEPVDGRWQALLPLPPDDGQAVVEIVAVENGGRESLLAVPVMIERSAPGLRIVAPRPDDLVTGTVTVAAVFDDASAVESIRLDMSDGESRLLEPDRLVTTTVSVADDADTVSFTTTTRSGARDITTVAFHTDDEADRPRVLLQVPEEGSATGGDLRLAGVVVDDAQPKAITYAINDGEPRLVETDGLFDVAIPLSGVDDGEHTVEVVGYDLGGTASEPVRRTFMLSRTDPIVELTFPAIDSFQRGVVTVTGTSTDPNGIASVSVSTDSGTSFNLAEGGELWRYEVDTTLLQDGTHSLLVRAVDRAGDEGLLATIINVDNTPPLLELSAPADGMRVTGALLVDGRAEDGNLRDVRISAQPLHEAAQGVELARFSSPGPFAHAVEPDDLEPGWYNLRVEASDAAGNTTHVSRNVLIEAAEVIEAPRIVIPADGQSLSGQFDVVVSSPPSLGPLTLSANGRPIGLVEIDDRGRGHFLADAGQMPAGTVSLSLEVAGPGTENNAARTVEYAAHGPWLLVDAPDFLAYVRDRPYVTGSAGYELVLPEGETREETRERDRIIAAHAVERVEVSLDNGESWRRARGTDAWQYRIETTELPDGRLNLLVRAQFADGSQVTRRHSVIVDERPPQVRLLEPSERDRFNNSLRVVGVTTDENELLDVSVALRSGDKARYGVPSFIQGLYLDVHVMGATYFDLGAGLTFFDNNVRLQGQIGLAPPGRFSGLVLGTKLLANIASVPASFFFGPDLEWLSAAVAVGANFSYFTMSEDSIAFTDEGLVLAGMVGQLEFPIVTVRDLPVFNTYALYTEAQLWFISSDVEAGTVFRMSFGMRANVF